MTRTLTEIFNIIKSADRERVFCIFNQINGDLWCNSNILLLNGDLQGMEYICEKCLYKKLDFYMVKKLE